MKFTKSDLKTGDVCLQRNGLVQIYLKEFDSFVTSEGYNSGKNFRKNLTHKFYNDCDIIKVRRPQNGAECVFCAFEELDGNLVYERKEIKIIKSKEAK